MTIDTKFPYGAEPSYRLVSQTRSHLELLAAEFALIAHKDQKRKYTGDPYIIHPATVAFIVRQVRPDQPEVAAAAWLHDVVEDCGVQPKTIADTFGPVVAEYVHLLTEYPSDQRRNTRKMHQRVRLANAPLQVQDIKLADLIDNSSSIAERDPKFAEVYLKEKRQLLAVMKGANQDLWNIANSFVSKFLDAWERFDPPPPPQCDLCSKKAVWQHPKGGLRCGNCPRPLS